MVNPAGKLMPWLTPLRSYMYEVDAIAKKRADPAWHVKLQGKLKEVGRKTDDAQKAIELWRLINSTMEHLKQSEAQDSKTLGAQIQGNLHESFEVIRTHYELDEKFMCCFSGALTEFYRGNTSGLKDKVWAAGGWLPVPFQRLLLSTDNLLDVFDAAPAVERMLFLTELFAGLSAIRAHAPELHSLEEVRNLSAGSLLDDLSSTSATGLFTVERLTKVAEDLPIEISGNAYSAIADSTQRADILCNVSASAAPPTNAQIGDFVMKVYLSYTQVAGQMIIVKSSVPEQHLNKLLKVYNAGADFVQMFDDVRALTNAFNATMANDAHPMTKALKALTRNANYIFDNLPHVIGLFAELKSLATSTNKADTLKSLFSLSGKVAEVATWSLETTQAAYKSAGVIEEFAGATALKVAKTGVLVLGTVVAIFEIYGAATGYAQADMMNDTSVAMGHLLSGASAAGLAVLPLLQLMGPALGIGTAAGPLGLIAIALIAIGLVGAYLIGFTANHPFAGLVNISFFGKQPSTSTTVTDAHYQFGPSTSAAEYSNSDLGNQMVALKTSISPIAFNLTTNQVSVMIQHTMPDRAHGGGTNGKPAMDDYPNWTIAISVINDTGATASLPNFADNSDHFRTTGGDAYLPPSQSLATLQAGSDVRFPNDYRYCEFKFKSPPDHLGRRLVANRKVVAYR